MEYKAHDAALKDKRAQTYWGTNGLYRYAAKWNRCAWAGILRVFCVSHPFVQFYSRFRSSRCCCPSVKTCRFSYDVFASIIAPDFNNFRAPQMALVMMQFAIQSWWWYGLTTLLELAWESDAATQKIPWRWRLRISSLRASSIPEWAKKAFKGKLTQKGLDQIVPWLFSQMTSDWLVTAFLGLAGQ